MYDFMDFVREVMLPVLLIAVFMISVTVVPVYFLSKTACYKQTDDFESRFGFFTSCQIKHNGEWIQWESYRGTNERK